MRSSLCWRPLARGIGGEREQGTNYRLKVFRRVIGQLLELALFRICEFDAGATALELIDDPPGASLRVAQA